MGEFIYLRKSKQANVNDLKSVKHTGVIWLTLLWRKAGDQINSEFCPLQAGSFQIYNTAMRS